MQAAAVFSVSVAVPRSAHGPPESSTATRTHCPAQTATSTLKCPPGSPERLWSTAFAASSVAHTKMSSAACAEQTRPGR